MPEEPTGEQSKPEERKFTLHVNPSEVEDETFVIRAISPHIESNPSYEMERYIEDGKHQPIEIERDPESMRQSLLEADLRAHGDLVLEWLGMPKFPEARIGDGQVEKGQLTAQQSEIIRDHVRGLDHTSLNYLMQKSLEDGLRETVQWLQREYETPDDMPEGIKKSLAKLQQAVHPPREKLHPVQ